MIGTIAGNSPMIQGETPNQTTSCKLPRFGWRFTLSYLFGRSKTWLCLMSDFWKHPRFFNPKTRMTWIHSYKLVHKPIGNWVSTVVNHLALDHQRVSVASSPETETGYVPIAGDEFPVDENVNPWWIPSWDLQGDRQYSKVFLFFAAEVPFFLWWALFLIWKDTEPSQIGHPWTAFDPTLPYHLSPFWFYSYDQINHIWLVVTGTWLLFSHMTWECHHPIWRSYFSEGWPNHQPDIEPK